jgi:hypothetical protein
MKRILIEMNTDLAVIPGALSSVLQPSGVYCTHTGWQKVDMS